MKQRLTRQFATLLLCALGACAGDGLATPAEPGPALASTEDALIFGADDRIEVGGTNDPRLLRAVDATAALVQSGNLTCASGTCALATGTHSTGNVEDNTSLALCPGAAQRGQRTAAFCTAFLVGTDLMVTAGHCLTTDAACTNARVVFGFSAAANGTNEVTNFADADVYRCTQRLGQHDEGSADDQDDWAVFRLDRPVSTRPPLSIRRLGVPAVGTELVGTGHPNGLPMKISRNGFVEVNTGTKQIRSDLDMYGGNSGSPVFERASMVVQGIHVNRAASHFVRSSDAAGNACAADRVCAAAAGCTVGASGVFRAWGGVMRISGTVDRDFAANLIPLRPVETLAVL